MIALFHEANIAKCCLDNPKSILDANFSTENTFGNSLGGIDFSYPKEKGRRVSLGSGIVLTKKYTLKGIGFSCHLR